MPYVNLNKTLVEPAASYIDDNWVGSENTNFLKKQVLARGGNLVLTPWSATINVADTIIGISAGCASIATVGKHKSTYDFALLHLDSSRKVLVRPYTRLLKTINPQAPFTRAPRRNERWMTVLMDSNTSDPLINGDGDGFITHYVWEALRNKAHDFYNSSNWGKRHIASRLTYALLAIASLVTRAVDGIIGVIAAGVSFLTLGKIESINNLAYRALQAPGIVKDLFYCTIKFINPWAGTNTIHLENDLYY